VEGGNIRVVDDGSGDEPEPWSPARRWRLAALAAIGLLFAALLLVPALRWTEEPTNNLPALASPTTTQASTASPPTTTVPPPTTTKPFTTTASAPPGLFSLAGRDVCAEPGECPNFNAALPGDNGMGSLPVLNSNGIPNEDRLDFLFGSCGSGCDLDARFVDPDNLVFGDDPWPSGRPFHVRHGFINEASEPLGEGFNVALYISRDETLDRNDQPEVIGADEAGFEPGVVYGYTPDYVLRAASDRCGPTFDSQTSSHPCEWFVYDFPDGLPAGRFSLWAVWEAPCSAWFELGFVSSTVEDARSEDVVETCEDPAQVISKFSSEVNSPFGNDVPVYSERRS
jgi:hypothetical protein